MNDILFYKTNEPIVSELGYQKMCYIIQHYFDILLHNEKELNNCQKEIFPIIILANYLKYKEILFTGAKNKAIDAILKNNDSDILKIECTTSVDFRAMQIISEYNQEHKSCYITPRTKVINANEEERQNYSDIIFQGSKHKRVFIPQTIPFFEEQCVTPFRECLIDDNLIKQYAEHDIKQINYKIQKGIESNCYKDFILVLSIKHEMPKEKLNFYSKIIYDFWTNVPINPFMGLFVVIYDSEMCKEYYKDKNYNPFMMPTPIFFYANSI